MRPPEEWQRLALWVAQPYADHRDAEDLRQEALLGAWKGVQAVRTGRLGRCSEAQAAVQGARWAVADYLRRGQRLTVPEPEWLSLDGEAAIEAAAVREPDPAPGIVERVAVEAALAALTEPDRRLLQALYWEEQSAQAIARERGCSFNRVWREASAARARLREVMVQ